LLLLLYSVLTLCYTTYYVTVLLFFFFQAEDGIRDRNVTGVQTCALPIFPRPVHGFFSGVRGEIQQFFGFGWFAPTACARSDPRVRRVSVRPRTRTSLRV